MERTSKIYQRKPREQPGQYSKRNPPILAENTVEEEDFDK